MSTLLLIHACGSAMETVFRHWESYKISGADIIGINTIQKPFEWPENTRSVSIGKDAYYTSDIENLPRRLVETMEFCLSDEQCSGYSDFMIIEYDSLFFKKPPSHPGGLFVSLAGKCPPTWKVKSTRFHHTPWWFDRSTMEVCAKVGRKLLDVGEFENGSPDIFLGRITDVAQITPSLGDTFSKNGLDVPGDLEKAVEAVKSGIWFLHGCKKKHEFDTLTKANKRLNSVLFVMACGSGEHVVKRHWDSYKSAGMDIIGINTIEQPFDWPEGVKSVSIGHDKYLNAGGRIADKSNLPVRLVECIEYFVLECDEYDGLFLTEYDSLFFKSPPIHSAGLYTTLAGYCPKQWKVQSSKFLHPPWWMDRETAIKIALCGGELIEKEYYENGSPDVFIGLIADLANIRLCYGGTWSCNSRDLRVKIADAEKAVREGVWFVHGCGEAEYFDRLMKAAGK